MQNKKTIIIYLFFLHKPIKLTGNETCSNKTKLIKEEESDIEALN